MFRTLSQLHCFFVNETYKAAKAIDDGVLPLGVNEIYHKTTKK